MIELYGSKIAIAEGVVAVSFTQRERQIGGTCWWNESRSAGRYGHAGMLTFESPDGSERVVVRQRADGAWTYRRQLRSDDEWGPQGPDCGIYDSAE
jgi:hypothetical protein